MREIKFRAWAQNGEVMVYQKDFFKFIDGGMMELAFEDDKIIGLYQMHENYGEEMSLGNPPLYSTDDMVKVMQFTGLKDKNGREIYEGDIVDTTYDGSTFIGVVVYDLSELDFKATDGKEHYRQNFQYLPCCDEIEVIGNIYENPELLEVAE